MLAHICIRSGHDGAIVTHGSNSDGRACTEQYLLSWNIMGNSLRIAVTRDALQHQNGRASPAGAVSGSTSSLI